MMPPERGRYEAKLHGWSCLRRPVRLAPSFVVPCLLAFLCFALFGRALEPAGNDAPSSGLGLLSIFVYGLSVFVHELTHLLVLRRNRVEVESITLGMGGVTLAKTWPTTAGLDFASPAFAVGSTLLLAAIGAVMLLVVPGRSQPLQKDLGFQLAAINGYIFLTGCAPPVLPCDGAKIARALVWKLTRDYARATRFAVRLGGATVAVLLLGGLTWVALPPFPHSGLLGASLVVGG